MEFYFKKPDEIPPEIMEQIYELIRASGEVGLSWVRDNLRSAFLIGYVMEEGNVIGTMTLKRPLEKYVRKLKEKAGVNLEGYLERGYLAVKPEFQGRKIAGRLVKGLIDRAEGKKMFVTINMDNKVVIHLTEKNGMKLAGKYTNERTGHEIGVFINE